MLGVGAGGAGAVQAGLRIATSWLRLPALFWLLPAPTYPLPPLPAQGQGKASPHAAPDLGAGTPEQSAGVPEALAQLTGTFCSCPGVQFMQGLSVEHGIRTVQAGVDLRIAVQVVHDGYPNEREPPTAFWLGQGRTAAVAFTLWSHCAGICARFTASM